MNPCATGSLGQRSKRSRNHVVEVFRTALHLGLTSFGGPIAHLGYFERTYVEERRWLTSEQYGGIVALCQLLPGPTSSQVGFLIGLKRAGALGALAAWVGFTFPSAVLMYVCATLALSLRGTLLEAIVHGLQLVAVAVVAQAVWNLARKFCRDPLTILIALAGVLVLLMTGGTLMQLAVLTAGALSGLASRRRTSAVEVHLALPVSSLAAWTCLALFGLLLIALPVVAAQFPKSPLALADVFYRGGALVFGGGHVVLPLLRDAMVPQGWISDERFLAGYGLAQALPGPLFTLAAYLGAANAYVRPSALAASIATICIFLPGLLLSLAGASLWSRITHHDEVRAAIVGINASVVAILGAALYSPVWLTAVHGGIDAGIAIFGFFLLARWRVPPIAIVVLIVTGSIINRLL